MKELYWISVLGSLKIVCIIAVPFVVIALIFFLAMYEDVYKGEKYDSTVPSEKDKVVCLKWLRSLAVSLVLVLSGCIFIPTSQELYTIYGVGSTIDYIKKNPEAKKLPDNLVNFLNRWLEDKQQ